MYNRILSHKHYIEKTLHDASLTADDYAKIYAYHLERVRDFQHERLIHFMVTCLFVVLTVVTLAAVLALPSTLSVVLPFLLALLAVFGALDCAYVWHYYHLENGVQSLYPLTEKLYKKL